MKHEPSDGLSRSIFFPFCHRAIRWNLQTTEYRLIEYPLSISVADCRLTLTTIHYPLEPLPYRAYPLPRSLSTTELLLYPLSTTHYPLSIIPLSTVNFGLPISYHRVRLPRPRFFSN